eukprot:4407243-Amphidinium_carterae.1
MTLIAHAFSVPGSTVEVFRKDNGASPLMSAAGEHYPCCVESLLNHRADVHAVDRTGHVPCKCHFEVREKGVSSVSDSSVVSI